MKMIVESMMERRLAGETEVLGENLPQRHFCPTQNPTCPPGFESAWCYKPGDRNLKNYRPEKPQNPRRIKSSKDYGRKRSWSSLMRYTTIVGSD
jgi:hypothetical protein